MGDVCFLLSDSMLAYLYCFPQLIGVPIGTECISQWYEWMLIVNVNSFY